MRTHNIWRVHYRQETIILLIHLNENVENNGETNERACVTLLRARLTL